MASSTSNAARLLLLQIAPMVAFLTGCAPLVRERTLPPSIRAVHVPMIVNRSAEPGLEERMTASFQKEILADGRLRLVRRQEADAIVNVEIRDFDRDGFSFDGDDFPTTQMFRIIFLWRRRTDNFDSPFFRDTDHNGRPGCHHRIVLRPDW